MSLAVDETDCTICYYGNGYNCNLHYWSIFVCWVFTPQNNFHVKGEKWVQTNLNSQTTHKSRAIRVAVYTPKISCQFISAQATQVLKKQK